MISNIVTKLRMTRSKYTGILCEDAEPELVCILETFHIQKRKCSQLRRAVSATRFKSQDGKRI